MERSILTMEGRSEEDYNAATTNDDDDCIILEYQFPNKALP